jgi:hypothetical protein
MAGGATFRFRAFEETEYINCSLRGEVNPVSNISLAGRGMGEWGGGWEKNPYIHSPYPSYPTVSYPSPIS